MKSPRLSSMLLTDLLVLRDKVDKVIAKRVAQERKHYEGKLAELSAYGSNGGNGKRRGRPPKVDGRTGKRAKVKRAKATPKFKGPNGELWSGRGQTPLWMRPLLKGGKKKEAFAIK